MPLFPPETPPLPCHACGRQVDLARTRCPHCSANLLVFVCPACRSITPRDAPRCTACAGTMPPAYRNLTDAETRELFAVELMININATSDQVAPDQRENFVRMYGLYKRRLLKEITEEEFKRGQADTARNMIKARKATADSSRAKKHTRDRHGEIGEGQSAGGAGIARRAGVAGLVGAAIGGLVGGLAGGLVGAAIGGLVGGIACANIALTIAMKGR